MLCPTTAPYDDDKQACTVVHTSDIPQRTLTALGGASGAAGGGAGGASIALVGALHTREGLSRAHLALGVHTASRELASPAVTGL